MLLSDSTRQEPARIEALVAAAIVANGDRMRSLCEELGEAEWSRPGVRRLPRMRTHSVSSKRSSVPLEVSTPRISSISARVTGW